MNLRTIFTTIATLILAGCAVETYQQPPGSGGNGVQEAALVTTAADTPDRPRRWEPPTNTQRWNELQLPRVEPYVDGCRRIDLSYQDDAPTEAIRVSSQNYLGRLGIPGAELRLSPLLLTPESGCYVHMAVESELPFRRFLNIISPPIRTRCETRLRLGSPEDTAGRSKVWY